LTAGFGAVSGYADVPLAASTAAALSCALLAIRTSQTRIYVLAGVLAAIAVWTKVEGIVLAISLGAGVIAASWSMWRRVPARNVPVWAATAVLWFPVALVFPWFVIQHLYAIPEADFPSMSPAIALGNLHRLPGIVNQMLGATLKPGRWGLLWPAFGVTFVLAVTRRELDDVTLVMAAAVVVPFVAYTLIFLFSGWDSVADHISVSVERLLVPLAPAALIFAVSRAWLSFT
jgi:hypothetical protein